MLSIISLKCTTPMAGTGLAVREEDMGSSVSDSVDSGCNSGSTAGGKDGEGGGPGEDGNGGLVVLSVSASAEMTDNGIKRVDCDRARVSSSEWCDERKEILEYKDVGEERRNGTDSTIEI